MELPKAIEAFIARMGAQMSYRYQITISDQANQILERLVAIGIYGCTVPEVMKRLVEGQLAQFVSAPAPKDRLG
jgi:hypothetical protein